MRACHWAISDKAFLLFDHMEGEAQDIIKYRTSADRSDPVRIIAILQELYGSMDSYVALQETFFSRKQQDGESLEEFSLALMSLMERIKQHMPDGMPKAEVILRDQFVEQVLDGALQCELKQLVWQQPMLSLLDVRREALRLDHQT